MQQVKQTRQQVKKLETYIQQPVRRPAGNGVAVFRPIIARHNVVTNF